MWLIVAQLPQKEEFTNHDSCIQREIVFIYPPPSLFHWPEGMFEGEGGCTYFEGPSAVEI